MKKRYVICLCGERVTSIYTHQGWKETNHGIQTLYEMPPQETVPTEEEIQQALERHNADHWNKNEEIRYVRVEERYYQY